MASPVLWLLGLKVVALSVALSLGVAAVVVSPVAPLRTAGRAVWLSAALAFVMAVGSAFGPWVGGSNVDIPSSIGSTLALVRVDRVTGVMLGLVSAIALVIVRYSRTYLDGEAGQARYARALLATLGSVSLLVISNNLLVIALAWLGTSLALHRLLTFYRDRPQALVAAHKKFLLSRLADGCVFSGVLLVASVVGSADLDVVNAWAQSNGGLPPSLQVAAVLLVVAVCLKSAQLPFHGWLTQVMEAPTPVSGLLHAGVVNIGGFVMIRLAPFMAHARIAQALLVSVGMTTAVVAALVMTTRVSVKVALAWSTCAQMGFMLVQCGLGAWDFAFLHLVAHSLYKAHAFLSSGTTVERWRVHALAPRETPPSLARSLAAPALALVVISSAVAFARTLAPAAVLPDVVIGPLTLVFALALVPLVVRAMSGRGRLFLPLVLRVIGVTTLYFGWHTAFSHLVVSPSEPDPSSALRLIVVAGFVVLFVVEAVLRSRPRGRLARALQPALFAGLYLDELFTRMTFRIWPPRLGAETVPHRHIPITQSQEVRP